MSISGNGAGSTVFYQEGKKKKKCKKNPSSISVQKSRFYMVITGQYLYTYTYIIKAYVGYTISYLKEI